MDKRTIGRTALSIFVVVYAVFLLLCALTLVPARYWYLARTLPAYKAHISFKGIVLPQNLGVTIGSNDDEVPWSEVKKWGSHSVLFYNINQSGISFTAVAPSGTQNKLIVSRYDITTGYPADIVPSIKYDPMTGFVTVDPNIGSFAHKMICLIESVVIIFLIVALFGLVSVFLPVLRSVFKQCIEKTFIPEKRAIPFDFSKKEEKLPEFDLRE